MLQSFGGALTLCVRIQPIPKYSNDNGVVAMLVNNDNRGLRETFLFMKAMTSRAYTHNEPIYLPLVSFFYVAFSFIVLN